ncbi:MAG: hypothetical protein ABGZ35_28385 [Planctomycetaceae bacterium]
MSQQELLILVIEALDRLNVDYFITGSWSSSLLGEPRSTHDLDLVVNIGPAMVDSLVASFSDEQFYLSTAAVSAAIQNGSMFNLLDLHSGDKVDFWLLTEEPWDQERFQRRQQADVFGTVVSVSSAEDTILAKLRWSKLSGGSEKQIQDAQGVYEVQRSRLDMAYIDQWANQLDITELWAQIKTSD